MSRVAFQYDRGGVSRQAAEELLTRLRKSQLCRMAASAEYAQEETEEILRETGILSEDDLSSAHKRQSLSGHCLGEPACLCQTGIQDSGQRDAQL